jgi:hypothetical protein
VAWILHHRRDVAADFQAIYHLSWADAVALPGPEFLALAYRLDAYQGVIAMRIQQQRQEERRNVTPGARLVDSDRASVQRDPILSRLVEVG